MHKLTNGHTMEPQVQWKKKKKKKEKKKKKKKKNEKEKHQGLLIIHPYSICKISRSYL